MKGTYVHMCLEWIGRGKMTNSEVEGFVFEGVLLNILSEGGQCPGGGGTPYIGRTGMCGLYGCFFSQQNL